MLCRDPIVNSVSQNGRTRWSGQRPYPRESTIVTLCVTGRLPQWGIVATLRSTFDGNGARRSTCAFRARSVSAQSSPYCVVA